MPTSETRTQASMTMPLSRTRSSTSMRLVPPEARSTAMKTPWMLRRVPRRGPAFRRRHLASQRFDLALEQPHLFAQLILFQLDLVTPRREVLVITPPVQADLLRLVDGADDQADADGEQLDLRQRDLDVAGDDEALVEHAVEHVHEPACLMSSRLKFGTHGEFISRPGSGDSGKGGPKTAACDLGKISSQWGSRA